MDNSFKSSLKQGLYFLSLSKTLPVVYPPLLGEKLLPNIRIAVLYPQKTALQYPCFTVFLAVFHTPYLDEFTTSRAQRLHIRQPNACLPIHHLGLNRLCRLRSQMSAGSTLPTIVLYTHIHIVLDSRTTDYHSQPH